MMNDIDIDIEDLESRLYSQVYHGSVDTCEDHNSISNLCDNASTARQNLRYFCVKQPRSSKSNELNYTSLTSDLAIPKIQTEDFFDVCPDGNINAEQQILINNNQILQSAVPCNNNIVSSPTPAQFVSKTNICNPNVWDVDIKNCIPKLTGKQRKRQRWLHWLRRLKRAKIYGPGAWKRAKKKKKHKLRDHCLNENISNQQDNRVVTISDSESNDSCVELLEPKHDLIVVSSEESDTEDKHVNEGTDEVKEFEMNNAEINGDSNVEKIKPADKPKKAVEQVHLSTQDEDDDIIFVDNIPEVIEIDCDAKSVMDIEDGKVNSESTSINSFSKQPESGVKQKTLTAIKERNELLKTPDSTSTSNDFLDNTVDLQQKRFNFGLHGSDFSNTETFVKPQSQTDLFETESSCRANDNTPIKANVFKEVEFESPNKNLFNEENLESFGNYITPNRSNTSENKTTPSEEFDQTLTKASVKAVRKLTSKCSDTSSESDYETSEATPIQERKATKQLPNLTSVESQSLLAEQESQLENSTNLKGSASNKRKRSISLEDETTPEKKTKDGSLLSTAINILRSAEKCKTTQNTKDSEIKHVNKEEVVKCPNKSDLSNGTISSEESDLSRGKGMITDIQLVNCKNTQKEPQKVSEPENISQIDHRIRKTEKNYSFSNYWTTDMNKFHNTSWGLENFDVKEIQKTMSNNPKLWRISDENRSYYKTRGHKRFRCDNRREPGNFAVNCASGLAHIVCTLCGQMGHVEGQCPNALCTLCGSRGGYGTYCSKCAKWRYMQCQICNMHGHLGRRCPDLWRRYHLTIEPGPIVKPLKDYRKNTADRWCSGCGSPGHYEYLCPYYMRQHHAVDPHIQEYHDVYNFPKDRPFLTRCLENISDQPEDKLDNNNTVPTDEAKPSTSKGNFGMTKNKSASETVTNISSNPEKIVYVDNETKSAIGDDTSKKIAENNMQLTSENFVYPPKSMIPAYFLKQMESFGNGDTTNSRNAEYTTSKYRNRSNLIYVRTHENNGKNNLRNPYWQGH